MQTRLLEEVQELASQFAQARSLRQRRRELVSTEFESLKQAGFPLMAVPVQHQGYWESIPQSTRPICDLLRILAHGDSSVALVCSMHPSVLTFWLAFPEAPEPFRESWQAQQSHIFQTVREGAWWGTITSEPGSGGDITRSKAIAEPGPHPGEYRLTGQKHFGSGTGITSFMLTTAVPRSAPEADWFFLDMRGVSLDGSAGVKLTAEWDGQGMTATQSHALSFQSYPAIRFAWPGNLQSLNQAAGGAIACYFAAVIVGIAEVAVETARHQLSGRFQNLRAYEKVEWTRVETESWLIQQAYEGMLRAVEEKGGTPMETRCGKMAIAELAESVLNRLCKILGGGTYTRYSPFAHWFEDVRALGFLRPPWGLAYEALFEASWAVMQDLP